MFYPSTLAVYFYNIPEGQGRIFKLGPTNLHVDSPACALKFCGDWSPRAPEWSPLTRDPRPGAPLDKLVFVNHCGCWRIGWEEKMNFWIQPGLLGIKMVDFT